VCKQSIAHHDQDQSANRIDRRHRQPQNRHEMQMLVHTAARWPHGQNGANNLFPALAAKCLTCLYRATASIAEHDAPPQPPQERE
jgi:hypothetical protein